MKIFLGADHKGLELKNKLKVWLNSEHEVEDLGAHEYVGHDDYTDYAEKVGRKVSAEEARLDSPTESSSRQESKGIVICGSGAGVDIVANKIKGVRSFIGFDNKQVKAARSDDDVNVLAISSDYISFDESKTLIKDFLNTDFYASENHVRRLEKIKKLES